MRIGLVGYGVVGSGIAEIITAAESPLTANLEIVKILTRTARSSADSRFTTNVDEFFATDFDVLIECAGGIAGPREYVLRALGNSIPVVTSNKKLFATHYEELLECAHANDTRILFDATTAGGIPWLRNIALTLQTDQINAFSGIFNGTTNYILAAMTDAGKDFATALADAQRHGFAEADPSDDICGYDVRYKCAISANLSWNTSLEVETIPCFGIENISPADISYAQEHDSVIKLIGHANRTATNQISAAVMPTILPASSPFAAVDANYNCAVLDSSFLGRSVYAGQGAGSLPTAFAVVQDIVELQTHGCRYSDLLPAADARSNASEKQQVDNSQFISTFYLRAPGLTAQSLNRCGISARPVATSENNDAYLSEPIALPDLLKAISKLAQPNLFVARIETA